MLVNFRCSIKKNLGVIFWNHFNFRKLNNKTDQTPGRLAENLFSKTNMCLASLRWDVIVLELCRKLQYFTAEDLTIEYYNANMQNGLFDLDTLLESENHLKDLPIFLDKISHLDIGGRRVLRWRLDWEELENQIYKKFILCIKSNIQTHLGCVTPIVTALTKFFNHVFVPNLNHRTYLTHKFNVICNHFCNKYVGFEKPFQIAIIGGVLRRMG